MKDQFHSKLRCALYGFCIGDALAMPVHWYYNRQALFQDYGRVTDYLAPRNPHPDSILWRSSYVAPNSRGEILHDQAAYWGEKGIHYHQFLKAGENTLNVKISQLLIESLNQNGGYDPDDFFKKYIRFMTTPGNHRDTYIEECHHDPENALIVNTNLGGDNAARGSVLGALLGASHGVERFPRRWIDGLVDPPPDILQNLESVV